jgi:hypothetical protein
MKKIMTPVLICLALFMASNDIVSTALADHHGRRERRRYHQREGRQPGRSYDRRVEAVTNNTYSENCGACHFSYQPGLLPSRSWDRILADLENHFGESIELDPGPRKAISKYLRTHAADHASSGISAKIMRCLGSSTPARITEIPFVLNRHHKIAPEVFKRDSIGSFSNCTACHTTAEKGLYDNKHVSIPK